MPHPLLIAVIDDEIAIANSIVRSLRRRGDVVVVAHSVQGGRDLLALHQGAVERVLIDRSLPDGDGLQLAEELHRTYPALAIIIMTGGEPPGTTEFAYLGKPFTLEELWAAVA
jgi:two-component system, OmpR family, response regulator